MTAKGICLSLYNMYTIHFRFITFTICTGNGNAHTNNTHTPTAELSPHNHNHSALRVYAKKIVCFVGIIALLTD